MRLGEKLVARTSAVLGIAIAAALLTLDAGAASLNRPVEARAKRSVLAADGTAPPACFILDHYNCGGLGSDGLPNGCGKGAAGNCTGNCDKACSNISLEGWVCWPGGPPGILKCPPLGADPMKSCGETTTDSTCSTVSPPTYPGNACYCWGGRAANPPVPCGKPNNQPVGPFEVCPDDPAR